VPDSLPLQILAAIRQFDTCAVANAIERFHLRLRNEGYTQPGLQCTTGGFPRVIGYAATSRVKSSNPPVTGRTFGDRTDWWGSIEQSPTPRIAVYQDLEPGTGGATIGQVHAAVLKAFDCVAVVTNGAVRDLPDVVRMDFPMFAAGVTVSHAYTHIVDFGQPVTVFGLDIRPGDLLYADCHGLLSIPLEIAAEIPAVAAEIRARERRIIDLCQSPNFTAQRLLAAIQEEP
jgi:regulator of RNase E activity RraA